MGGLSSDLLEQFVSFQKRANGTLWIDRNPRCMIVLYKYNNKSTIDHDNKLMIKIWEKSD